LRTTNGIQSAGAFSFGQQKRIRAGFGMINKSDPPLQGVLEDSARTSTPICDGYRFGDFEVRAREGVLLHNGEVVPLQRLPFLMLIALLDNAGQLVSHDDLKQRLWSGQTFVEFDNNLYVAAAKLREALQRSPDGPQHILTEPRKGYRFTAPVLPVYRLPVDDKASEPVGTVPGKEDKKRRFQSRAFLLGAGCFFLAALFGALAYTYHHRKAPQVSREDIVTLGGFSNRTGNPELDGMFTSAFRLELRQSPYLRFVEDPTFEAKLKDLNRIVLDDELAACRAVNGRALLTGQVSSNGKEYLVELDEWKCTSGALLAREQNTANAPLSILNGLATAANNLRRRMGEPDESLHDLNTTSTHATTKSLPALKDFSLGEQ
jgi:DNA-binding winged helix-turn-helix (wHTH) protein